MRSMSHCVARTADGLMRSNQRFFVSALFAAWGQVQVACQRARWCRQIAVAACSEGRSLHIGVSKVVACALRHLAPDCTTHTVVGASTCMEQWPHRSMPCVPCPRGTHASSLHVRCAASALYTDAGHSISTNTPPMHMGTNLACGSMRVHRCKSAAGTQTL